MSLLLRNVITTALKLCISTQFLVYRRLGLEKLTNCHFGEVFCNAYLVYVNLQSVYPHLLSVEVAILNKSLHGQSIFFHILVLLSFGITQ
jgi:hypothetical protein